MGVETLAQVWGVILILLLCPLLGGLPLVRGLVAIATGKDVRAIGTGNSSVSAAFYHGGRWVGILAVLSEAGKGIAAVVLARQFFPSGSAWELVALMALVLGRYWLGGGAGATNATWGCVWHEPIAAGLTAFVGMMGFTLVRDRRQGRAIVLVLYPLLIAFRHPYATDRIACAALLCALLAWIYQKVPDDLDLNTRDAAPGSQSVFRFFRGDRAGQSLDDRLDRQRVGAKAANLSRLKRWGYAVPMGWVLQPGDDPLSLASYLAGKEPSIEQLADGTFEPPLIVRSSAVGEDEPGASAAGQYASIAPVLTPDQLIAAIQAVFRSYDAPAAVQYRRDRHIPEASMAVLVQPWITGVFSGVAFSRDPITRQGETVVVEALPGSAAAVVSGQRTPESFSLDITDADLAAWREGRSQRRDPHGLPGDGAIAQTSALVSDGVTASGDVPRWLLREVAFLARDLEQRDRGVPQDIEWTYDGERLWILQARPISTLLPIWTRKIAAEAIPGVIRPLTWSINRPLTCGVWGQIFTVVLGDRAARFNFADTADLHFGHAYFNASLLGEIFLTMGLPPESLEVLTRGAKFSRPSLQSTITNLPGLLRLVQRERRLEQDFRRDSRQQFAPGLAQLDAQPARPDVADPNLPAVAWGDRITHLLTLLDRATYYSILAPLSAAARQGLWRVPPEYLDPGESPEVAATRSLQAFAKRAYALLDPRQRGELQTSDELFATLATTQAGCDLLESFGALIDRYGYLSEVGTDIAVPTWHEDSTVVRELAVQFVQQQHIGEPLPFNPMDADSGPRVRPDPPAPRRSPRAPRAVQRRLDLKGRVTELYSRLLAELRWSFVALEARWIAEGVLGQPGDIFFLTWEEVQSLLARLPSSQAPDEWRDHEWRDRIARRRAEDERDRQRPSVPYLVYGADPPTLPPREPVPEAVTRGLAASAGQMEGTALVVRNLTEVGGMTWPANAILVVPYVDSAWGPVLARSRGLVCETGGRLSHGAIVAREYGIPAVLDVPDATRRFRTGQRLRLDGQTGTIEAISPD